MYFFFYCSIIYIFKEILIAIPYILFMKILLLFCKKIFWFPWEAYSHYLQAWQQSYYWQVFFLHDKVKSLSLCRFFFRKYCPSYLIESLVWMLCSVVLYVVLRIEVKFLLYSHIFYSLRDKHQCLILLKKKLIVSWTCDTLHK